MKQESTSMLTGWKWGWKWFIMRNYIYLRFQSLTICSRRVSVACRYMCINCIIRIRIIRCILYNKIRWDYRSITYLRRNRYVCSLYFWTGYYIICLCKNSGVLNKHKSIFLSCQIDVEISQVLVKMVYSINIINVCLLLNFVVIVITYNQIDVRNLLIKLYWTIFVQRRHN